MYKNRRAECYSKLKTLTQDQDISECILLINKVKEYRHSKIKGKQINKFDRLLRKCNGYHNNFGTFSRQSFLLDACTIPTIPTYRITVLPAVL